MKILVTGVAGFIGYHLTNALLDRNQDVIGLDNLNNYYDPSLKQSRLDQLANHPNYLNFKFIKSDISDKIFMDELFESNSFDIVINLAAQAGVRYSISNPSAYIDSNIIGFTNILEGCRNSKVKHLIYASSSSVYGMNTKQPFSTEDCTDFPISLYAATKKSNELMAHTYSHLFNLPTTGLRFFTVYGPYGRPDMAYFKFTQAIFNGDKIDVYNNGDMKRDFTYIDDIIQGIIRILDIIPQPQSNDYTSSRAPYALYNIGNNKPITLKSFISAIEIACAKKANRNYLPMQPGDVPLTYADVEDLVHAINFKPTTEIQVGIKKFVDWYIKYTKS
jgi:UDP-glucuronate 4-epimerase